MFKDKKDATGGQRHPRPFLGYRMINPHDPPSVPRRFEPINPVMQRRLERLFCLICEAP